MTQQSSAESPPGPTRPRRWQAAALRSGLFRRVLPLVLLVSLLPLILLGMLNWLSVTSLKNMAMEESYDALATQSLQSLELRAVDLSLQVSSFLEEREQDLLQLASLEPSAEAYIDFSRTKRGILWTPQGKFELPLYREISFVAPDGRELIRVVDERVMPDGALRDVSRPENTEYKRETLFADAGGLGPGEVYVQRPLGWYLPVPVAYANAANPLGQRYQGVIRFATPLYNEGGKKGLLILSLDWTHVMELIAHVVGSEEGYVVEIPLDPETGKLAEIGSCLVGDDGWTLVHPLHHAIAGLDENGQYVPAYNERDRAQQDASGDRPLNADDLAFLGDEAEPYPWPIIAAQNRQGQRSGQVPRYGSTSGVPKAMAWAGIPYDTPPFDTPAGFGWVGLSIDAKKFDEAPKALGAKIGRRATTINSLIYSALGLATLLAAAAIGNLIYRTVARPIGQMVTVAQQIAGGDLTPIAVDAAAQEGDDELAQLQLALAQMVANLRSIITRIHAAALHISTSAGEVRATLHEQAGAAKQSATAVTETTSTMEELAIIAAQIAERSGSVVGDAAETQQDAQAGARAVADTVAKLDEIRAANEVNVQEILALGQKSRRIGEVMELIDSITSRTKLIAFNATLEAAAAGEQGRRFGVVAMEVRRLADNVVESTVEIRERIAEIQAATNALVIASEQEAKRIGEGVAHGQDASRALAEILDGAQSTTTSAEQISLSTQQQQTAAEQVVEAVRGIQTDSQAVAQGSAEATRVVDDLVKLAEELQQVVAQFDLAAVPDELPDGGPRPAGGVA